MLFVIVAYHYFVVPVVLKAAVVSLLDNFVSLYLLESTGGSYLVCVVDGVDCVAR